MINYLGNQRKSLEEDGCSPVRTQIKFLYSFVSITIIILSFFLGTTGEATGISSKADPLIVAGETEKYDLSRHLLIYEEKESDLTIESNLTIEDILTMGDIYNTGDNHNTGDIRNTEDTLPGSTELQFYRNEVQTPAFGYTDTVIWSYFEISNTAERENWYLEVANPILNKLELYQFSGDGKMLNHTILGNYYPFSAREVKSRNFIFPLELKPEQDYFFYLRIQSQSAMIIPITLWSPQAHDRMSKNEKLFYGIYYGIILAIIAYYLFISFNPLSLTYLAFTLHIISFLFFQMSWDGVAFEYLWHSFPWWSRQSLTFSMANASLWIIVFSMRFFRLKESAPTLNKIMTGLLVYYAVTVPLTLFIPYSLAIKLTNNTLPLSGIMLIICGFVCLKRGYKAARYHVMGQTIFIISAMNAALLNIGVMPENITRMYGVKAGIIISILFYAMALGERVKIINQEKDQARQEALETQKHLAEYNKEWGHELAREVTERTRELDQQTQNLVSANEKLQKIDKHKTETLYMVTHDLRTPMTAIVGFSQLISKKYQSVLMPILQNDPDKKVNRATKQIKQNINIISEEGRRLTELINDYLDLSKLEEGKAALHHEILKVEDIINESLNSLVSQFKEKKLEAIKELQDELPAISADKEKLIQVMTILISNALNSANPGGSITCRAVKDNQEIIVSVIDTGKGLSAPEQECVFEKFSQAGKEISHKGTGLSLPICKQIIELHGGRIWVESGPGMGCSFSFSLPAKTGRLC